MYLTNWCLRHLEYIFRCPKVSILIENIYISNQLCLNGCKTFWDLNILHFSYHLTRHKAQIGLLTETLRSQNISSDLLFCFTIIFLKFTPTSSKIPNPKDPNPRWRSWRRPCEVKTSRWMTRRRGDWRGRVLMEKYQGSFSLGPSGRVYKWKWSMCGCP